MVEEVGRTDPALEVRQDVGHILHQFLLALEVVEAEQRQVLVDREEDLAVDLGQRVVADQLDVGHEGDVDALGDVDGLEELVVALLLVEVVVDDVLVEHGLLHEHQRFDVLEVDVLLERPREEEEVLQDARPLGVQFLHRVVGLLDVVGELFVPGLGDLEDVLVGEHVELFPHVLQRHVHLEQVALAAHQDALELVDQVLPLLEDRTQHLQRRAEQLVVLVDGQFEEGEHHGVEVGLAVLPALEEVAVLAHVLDGPAVLEGRELLELVAPDVLLEHDVLVLADLLHLPQDGRVLGLLKLLLGPYVALG